MYTTTHTDFDMDQPKSTMKKNQISSLVAHHKKQTSIRANKKPPKTADQVAGPNPDAFVETLMCGRKLRRMGDHCDILQFHNSCVYIRVRRGGGCYLHTWGTWF
ncbi:hypothetical protein HanRHA438_Chr08g0343461 [Helianthus annuus]|nr:hypothetical protein HanRHA438_Chr08g0343461 [Helianthus annuus]